jgi:caffeoyl-CoA O-methyltransferase
MADNVLWSGKILDAKALEKDQDTIQLDLFNKKILADSRVENLLLPIRDGIMMLRKL